jgi:alcohol dehydrogenase class IV
MEPPAGEYSLTQLERVVFGAGSVARLGGELDRLGASRAVVVTGRTLSTSPLLDRVTGALGSRCVQVFAGARQHVPATAVADLVRVLDSARADCVVSFGGGSPIDAAKAATQGRVAALPHVAVPTTLSAGEFTAVAGITDDASRVKHAVVDPRLAPRVVVLDPELTVETPEWLWAASGMRAVDHAVETLYSTLSAPGVGVAGRRSAAAARVTPRAVARRHAPRRAAAVSDRGVDERAGIALCGLGLSHALGHQIGPRWNVAHGVTSSITLPHAMRAIARKRPDWFEAIAGALHIPFETGTPSPAALACADAVAGLVARLGLPSSLSAVGVPRADLDGVAEVVHDAMSHALRVGHAVTLAEVSSVLAAAFLIYNSSDLRT